MKGLVDHFGYPSHGVNWIEFYRDDSEINIAQNIMSDNLFNIQMGPVFDLDSNYYFWRCGNFEDKRLFIVFSCLGTKPGIFSFFNIFQKLKLNVLHVTSTQINDWFLSGLHGLAPNAIEAFPLLSKRINHFISEHGFTSLHLVGTSMGGYAAILYGHFCPLTVPTHIIASSIEAPLRLPNSVSLQVDLKIDAKTFDLRDAYFEKFSLTLTFGEFDIVDSFSALSLKGKPNVRLLSHTTAGHLLPEKIEESIGFESFIRSLINGVYFFPFQGRMADALEADDLSPLVFQTISDEAYLPALQRCLEKYPGFGFGWNRLGAIEHNRSNLIDAKRALLLSKLINSNFGNTHDHLNIIEKKLTSNNVHVNE